MTRIPRLGMRSSASPRRRSLPTPPFDSPSRNSGPSHGPPARRHAGWRRWLAGGDDTTIVLHVGRLAREKNLDVLAAAWTLARRDLGQRATFVIAGEGPATRGLVTRMPWVRQLGFVDR